jgi:hypothetical protein
LRPVAGFRRIAAARAAGLDRLPARVHRGDAGEAFLQAVEEHAGQPVNLRERLRALQVARRLGWDEQRTADALLPALGLEPHPALIRQHRRLEALPEVLLDLLVDKGFSLRRCLPLTELGQEAGRGLARLAAELRPGARQLEQAAVWLLQVARRERLSPGEVLQQLTPAPGQSAADWLRLLRARRYPEASRRRAAIRQAGEGLAGGRVRVGFDPNLGRESVELSFSVADPEQLRELAGLLGGEPALAQLAAVLERLRS